MNHIYIYWIQVKTPNQHILTTGFLPFMLQYLDSRHLLDFISIIYKGRIPCCASLLLNAATKAPLWAPEISPAMSTTVTKASDCPLWWEMRRNARWKGMRRTWSRMSAAQRNSRCRLETSYTDCSAVFGVLPAGRMTQWCFLGLHLTLGLVLCHQPIKTLILQEGSGLCGVNSAKGHLKFHHLRAGLQKSYTLSIYIQNHFPALKCKLAMNLTNSFASFTVSCTVLNRVQAIQGAFAVFEWWDLPWFSRPMSWMLITAV